MTEDQGNSDGDRVNLPLLNGGHSDDLNRAIMKFGIPNLNGLSFGIAPLDIIVPQFKLKLVIFQMLQTMG